MLSVEQIHEAVGVLQSMGYSVVKLRHADGLDGTTWYRGHRVTIGDEYTIPDDSGDADPGSRLRRLARDLDAETLPEGWPRVACGPILLSPSSDLRITVSPGGKSWNISLGALAALVADEDGWDALCDIMADVVPGPAR